MSDEIVDEAPHTPSTPDTDLAADGGSQPCRLCAQCLRFFRGSVPISASGINFFSGKLEDHYASAAQLLDGIDSGCEVCIRAWRHLGRSREWVEQLADFKSEYTYSPGPGQGKHTVLRLIMRWHETAIGSPSSATIIFNLSAPLPDADITAPLPKLSASTSSDETFSLMRKWYTDCTSHHEGCSWRVQQVGWHPSRLIDVGPPGSTLWCLRVGPDISAGGRLQGPPPPVTYMTLSHRWGDGPFVRLTTGNLASFQAPHEHAIAALPQTFQDAIRVAHALDIRFLWVDSLCILQDNLADWEVESLSMRQVYSHSACNLVAAHAAGPSDGLFGDRSSDDGSRDPVISELFRIRGEWVRRPPQHYVIWDDSAVHHDFGGAPLNSRGWVFQERLLPPRYLHFGRHQVFWRCAERVACEAMPDGVLPTDDKYGLQHLEDLSALREFLPPANATAATQHGAAAMADTPAELWMRLVAQYSRCDLTFAQDKLVALSGIAKLFFEVTGDTYLAGLWLSRLPEQLCWRRSEYTERPGPANYRAPSWSWAAIDGKIQFQSYRGKCKTLIQVESASIQGLTHDQMGQVTDGHIIATGYLSSFKVLFIDRHLDFELNGHPCFINGRPFQPDADEDLQGAELWLLPVLASFEEVFDDADVQTLGVVLRRVGDEDRDAAVAGVYRRVGFLHINPYYPEMSGYLGIGGDQQTDDVIWKPLGHKLTLKIV